MKSKNPLQHHKRTRRRPILVVAFVLLVCLLGGATASSASAMDSVDPEGDCPLGDRKVVIFDGPEGHIYRCEPPPPGGDGEGGGSGGHGGNQSGDGDGTGWTDWFDNDPWPDIEDELGPGMSDEEFDDWLCQDLGVCEKRHVA